MILLRSLCFHILFYTGTTLMMFVLFPFLILPKPLFVPQAFTGYTAWLLKYVINLNFEVDGKEHIPADRAFLIVSNHQSSWETLMFFQLFKHPVMILKKELMHIPIFGWFLTRTGMLSLDRKSPAASFRALLRNVNTQINHENRPVCIFPEGTRNPPGMPRTFQRGVYLIQKQIKANILCVAHNAGLYWAPRTFVIQPGTVKVFIYPLLPQTLEVNQLEEALPRMIHSKSNELAKDKK